MQNTEDVILNNLVNNEEYCRKALPHIKMEYFEGVYKKVYALILKYVGQYNSLPNTASLNIELQNSEFSSDQEINEIYALVSSFQSKIEVDPIWLYDTSEKWCKDRAVYNAVMESISIIDGRAPDKNEGQIPDLLSKALSVTFDTNVGHDYIENADDRYSFYHLKEDKIPFDIEMFNTITNGGVPAKTLNIFMASTGVGKSLTMCHLAASYLAQCKNVLYITMEMAEERIAERIDANLFDVRIDQIKNLSKESFDSKIGNVSKRTHGKLIIKEYPTASAHVGHFRALLLELKMKKKFKPDVIFIDYLNICASSRIKGLSGGVNTYSLVKAIAEELRGLAVENNVPLWSATQVNRSGASNSDIELTDTSESFGLPATCDLFLALISSEQLESMNQIMVKQLKNRYNDISTHKRFTVGIDRPKMRLYDVSDPMANLVSTSQVKEDEVDVSPFKPKKRNNNFSDFNVK